MTYTTGKVNVHSRSVVTPFWVAQNHALLSLCHIWVFLFTVSFWSLAIHLHNFKISLTHCGLQWRSTGCQYSLGRRGLLRSFHFFSGSSIFTFEKYAHVPLVCFIGLLHATPIYTPSPPNTYTLFCSSPYLVSPGSRICHLYAKTVFMIFSYFVQW